MKCILFLGVFLISSMGAAFDEIQVQFQGINFCGYIPRLNELMAWGILNSPQSVDKTYIQLHCKLSEKINKSCRLMQFQFKKKTFSKNFEVEISVLGLFNPSIFETHEISYSKVSLLTLI